MSSSPSREDQRVPTSRRRGTKEPRAPAAQQAQPAHRDDSQPYEDDLSPTRPDPPRRKGTSRVNGKDVLASEIPSVQRRKEDNSNPRREDDLPTDLSAASRRTGNSRPHNTDDLTSDIPAPRGRRGNNIRRADDIQESPVPGTPPRKSTPSKSRLTSALKSRMPTDSIPAQPNGGQSPRCRGTACEFRIALNREEALRKRTETQLETTKQQLDEARIQITKIERTAAVSRDRIEAKQNARQQKLSVTEQKRRERLDATEKKRREEMEHKLALEQLNTTEVRLAREEARRAKYNMVEGVAATAGQISADAYGAQNEKGRASGSGSRTAARRPTTSRIPASRSLPAEQYRE